MCAGGLVRFGFHVHNIIQPITMFCGIGCILWNILCIQFNYGDIPQNTPKLRNVNPYNLTHSLISRNPRERLFVVQISLLIVTFLSLISQNMVINENRQRSQPTPSH